MKSSKSSMKKIVLPPDVKLTEEMKESDAESAREFKKFGHRDHDMGDGCHVLHSCDHWEEHTGCCDSPDSICKICSAAARKGQTVSEWDAAHGKKSWLLNTVIP
jgi:hypothetical protein